MKIYYFETECKLTSPCDDVCGVIICDVIDDVRRLGKVEWCVHCMHIQM